MFEAGGDVSSWQIAASTTDVMSLGSCSSTAAPRSISNTPSVDAFDSACMRARTSSKRTTPIAASSTKIEPMSARASPISTAAFDEACDHAGADGAYERDGDERREERAVVGPERLCRDG